MQPTARQWLLAAVALYLDEAQRLAADHGLAPDLLGWHSSHATPAAFSLRWGSRDRAIELQGAQRPRSSMP